MCPRKDIVQNQKRTRSPESSSTQQLSKRLKFVLYSHETRMSRDFGVLNQPGEDMRVDVTFHNFTSVWQNNRDHIYSQHLCGTFPAPGKPIYSVIRRRIARIDTSLCTSLMWH
jgi:hypothetical protein